MKQIFKLLSCIALLVIMGCQFNKPPAGYFTVWEKTGADRLEVKKALLECGMPAPYDVFPENRNLSNNAWATIEACMIQAGFHDKYDVGGAGVEIIKPKISRFVVQALLFHREVSRSA